jgi:protein-disulfide isomerase
MSRKSRRNRPDPSPEATAPLVAKAGRVSRRGLVVGGLLGALAIAAAAVLFSGKNTGDTSSAPGDAAAALASEHAPQLGDPQARVHIVEFLDPACETCALFYPLVKQLLAQNPGKIRLSVRHVAFHEGADYVVRLLEAAREQDKYWETLETLLAKQAEWAIHHVVHPDLALQAVAAVGLDLERLAADMESPEVHARVQRDRADAMTLEVTKTPQYFVNGRQMPSFGHQQLLTLVGEELRKAY